MTEFVSPRVGHDATVADVETILDVVRNLYLERREREAMYRLNGFVRKSCNGFLAVLPEDDQKQT